MNATDNHDNNLPRQILAWTSRQLSAWQYPQKWQALRAAVGRYYRDLGTVVPEHEESGGPGVKAEASSRRLVDVAGLSN